MHVGSLPVCPFPDWAFCETVLAVLMWALCKAILAGHEAPAASGSAVAVVEPSAKTLGVWGLGVRVCVRFRVRQLDWHQTAHCVPLCRPRPCAIIACDLSLQSSRKTRQSRKHLNSVQSSRSVCFPVLAIIVGSRCAFGNPAVIS